MARACFSLAPGEAAVDVSFLVTVLVDGDLVSEMFDGLHVPDNCSYIIGADIRPTGAVRMGETTGTMELIL